MAMQRAFLGLWHCSGGAAWQLFAFVCQVRYSLLSGSVIDTSHLLLQSVGVARENTHTHTHAHTHSHTPTHTRTHTHTLGYIHSHTHTLRHIHTSTSTSLSIAHTITSLPSSKYMTSTLI